MKDPLFNDESEHPYELLGVSSSATADEINLAYKRGFAGPNRVQLRTAQSILLDPKQRVVVDLFDLADDGVRTLSGAEPSAADLQGSRRQNISQRWWAVQKDAFPDFHASHGLAVLFYWWANTEEEAFLEAAGKAQGRQGLEQAISRADVMRVLGSSATEAGTPAANVADELWKWAIAHWALLLEWEQFWNRWLNERRGIYGEVNGDSSNAVRAAVSAKIESRLRRFADRSQSLGATARANQLRKIELALINERAVARELVQLKAGILTNDGAVPCGRLMLELLGALGAVRERLARQLTRENENVELQTTWLQLSEHSHILTLLERGDWKAALDALEQLPENERNGPEARELLARALNAEANHHALRDDSAAAFEKWKAALACTRFEGLKKTIQDAVIAHCKKRVAALQGSDLGRAFDVVEAARGIASSDSLNSTLSHLHVLRSEQHYQNAASAAQSGGGPADIEREIRDCINELKRAVTVDPNNQDAARQLRQRDEELESYLAPAEMASRLGKNPTVTDVTAEIEKLDTKAIKSPAQKSILAQLFNARAVAKLNGIQKAVEDAKKDAGDAIRGLFKWGWLPRIPFYLLLPIILYFAYRTKNVADTALWSSIVWGVLFVVWLLARVSVQSMKFDPFAPPPGNFFLFCKVCARMTSHSYSLPGYGNACLCDKHSEEVNSILQGNAKFAVYCIASDAAQDVHRALKLWPDFEQAKQTLASIEELDPTAVRDHSMGGARPEVRKAWETVVCPRCKGQGECSLCLGKHTVSAHQVQLRKWDLPDVPILCPACEGSRVANRLECTRCSGTGMQSVPRREFRRLLRKPYARPFSKHYGVKAWEQGVWLGMVLGPFTSRHIKRLKIERAKIWDVVTPLLEAFGTEHEDPDIPGLRFGGASAYAIYVVCALDFLLRDRVTIATTVTLVAAVLWFMLFRSLRKDFK